MSIFRKLIIREWFFAFSASFLGLFLLVSVANLITGFLRSNVSSTEVIINFLLELPSFLSKIIPISCLMGSLFSLNKMKNRNELEAIFASGFSRKKLLGTIAYAAAVVGIFQFLISGYIGPFAKKHRHTILKDGVNKFRNMKSKGLKASTIGTGKMWYRSGNYFFSFASFDQKVKKLENITLYSMGKENKIQERISAPRAIYLQEKNWELQNGIRYYNLNKNEFPQINKFKTLIIELAEDPSDMHELESDITTLNVASLYSYIDNVKSSGINTNEYEIIFYDKFSSALMCIIFAILASGTIFKPNRRGSSFGKNIGFVFIFTILYWLVHSYLIEIGKNAIINPILASFGVAALFISYLLFYFNRHKQLR